MLYALRCTVGMAAFKGLVPPHHNDSALSLCGQEFFSKSRTDE
jgi:hypothetical protein